MKTSYLTISRRGPVRRCPRLSVAANGSVFDGIVVTILASRKYVHIRESSVFPGGCQFSGDPTSYTAPRVLTGPEDPLCSQEACDASSRIRAECLTESCACLWRRLGRQSRGAGTTAGRSQSGDVRSGPDEKKTVAEDWAALHRGVDGLRPPEPRRFQQPDADASAGKLHAHAAYRRGTLLRRRPFRSATRPYAY